MSFKFALGAEVKDVVTDFQGIVVGRGDHITGCNTYGLQPPAKDGKFENASWFDEHRLEATGKVITLPEPVQQETRLRGTGASSNPAPTRTVG